MPDDVLATLGTLRSGEGDRLVLEKVWPRRNGTLGLEYVDQRGRSAFAQWFGTNGRPDQARLVAARRAVARAGTSVPGAGAAVMAPGVLVHLGGADDRLPGLAALCSEPGATLVAHRPGRRAVVHLQAARSTYVKVIRASRVEGLLRAHRMAMSRPGFVVPELLGASVEHGTTAWAALPGTPLDGGDGSLGARCEGMRRVGAALRAFHCAGRPDGVRSHTAEDEAHVVGSWVGYLAALRPARAAVARAALDGVVGPLVATRGSPTLIHGDLHEKQLTVSLDGSVGLLDLDSLACGDAALDVANLLVHLELQETEGRITEPTRRKLSTSLLDGYDPAPAVARRLTAYADSSRLRLACVYALRPRWQACSHLLLTRIGTTVA